ncbi:hypothetical protein LSCM1_01977 [Leishmania martiniquensis]|uniref:Flagellar Member 7 n=1 Tax=Leishmania martiniquensis TaxID=1580590 RepID=A0A836GC76_9TRYP|nr:hypothetical protein LSCM1_01977 [Leishmania martiniquensis]
MAAAVRRYSLAHPPPVEGELNGHETAHEAEILELQALQAERDGEGGRSVLLMERALQIRCHLVSQLHEKWASAASGPNSTSSAAAHRSSVLAKPDAVGKEELLQEYQAQCSELYDAAERLVVRCNELGVEHFKRDAFAEASPLLEYAMQLTEDSAYPLCEVEERRRHLRGVTLNNLGCMERRRGHFSEALQYMKSSMEMTGVESPVAYMNTSAILIQLRLSEEAVRMAERSIELLYQTPEDPSLLAVAHHNLAMALEPVDSARCLEEYALAYRTACSTLGPESETARSIQRSWRRYEMTRVPPATGPFFMPTGGAGAFQMRESAGAAPIKYAATAPHRLPVALPPRAHKGKSGGSSCPMDVAELFPHPFLPSASAPSAPARAPRNVTPIYRPAALPRRPLVSGMPPSVAASLSKRNGVPESQSTQPPPQQHRGQYGAKVLRPSPPASRMAAVSARQPPTDRTNEVAAAAGSERVATATTPSSPPSHQVHAATSQRYSRAARAQESSRQPPSRASTRQHEFSVRNSTVTGPATAGMPLKRERSPSRFAHDRLTTQTTPTTQLTLAAQPPGRESIRTARNSGNGKPSPLPLPRHLPPLQTGAALEPPATAPRLSYTRSSHSGVAHEPLPLTSASCSLESDPLTFLQQRLDILLQDEEELEQKYAHATVIQRYYRGHLTRRRVAALRSSRAIYGRLAQLRRHMAARRIQRAFRRHRRDSRYPLAAGRVGRFAGCRGRRGVQHHAATEMQRIARGWLAWRRYAQLRKYAFESPIAASCIQRWIRALHARRHYAALRAEKAQQEAEALELERRQYAATRIQGQWHTHVQRRACKVALQHRMMARAAEDARRRVKAAISIQSAWRGHQARRLYRDIYSHTTQLRKARLAHEHRRQAAVKLQSFGRMLIAKQHALPLLTTARLRAAVEIQTHSREGRAATAIQCAYRSHMARRMCAAKRAKRKEQLRHGMLQLRTATLQRTGRGYMARKDVATRLSELQIEAGRYDRRLQALQRHELETARTLQQAHDGQIAALRDSEFDERAVLELAQEQQRCSLHRQCRESMPGASEPLASQEVTRHSFSPPSHTFSLRLQARQTQADYSRPRDQRLDRRTAQDGKADKKTTVLPLADSTQNAATRSTPRPQPTMTTHNDARPLQEDDRESIQQQSAKHIAAERRELDRLEREELLASEACAASPERPLTAEQIAAERRELDRLEREELLASEACAASPERPLTAEQIAAERRELDRLEREELLASEACAASPERPLTAEQIAAERRELDRLEREELLASEACAASPERPLTAEQIAAERRELDRLEREELLASEACAASPERPLTAEQIAAERRELDRLEREELLASEACAASPERPLTAEQIAAERRELDRLEREELLASEACAASPERPLTAEQIAAERRELDRLEREELLASEACAASPERPLTAEQIAAERRELDRLEREELLASEACAASPERPLTAEQIAAERRELDRLEREELLASEACAASPERPLTAEQIAAERRELDRLEREELLGGVEMDLSGEKGSLAGEKASVSCEGSFCTVEVAREMLASKMAVWQAELVAEKRHREEAEARQWASHAYRQEQISAASGEADLIPFRMGRSRPGTAVAFPSATALLLAAESVGSLAGTHHGDRAAQEAGAARCIERYYLGWEDRRFLKALQHVRDVYLSAMQDFELQDGPVLVNERLCEVRARYRDLGVGVSQSRTCDSPAGRSTTGKGRPYRWTPATWGSRKFLKDFVRIIKGKQQRAERSRARDSYLDRCAAEDGEAHEKASARVVADFMRNAAARNTLRRRAKIMNAYNDARALQEEVDRESVSQQSVERLASDHLGHLGRQQRDGRKAGREGCIGPGSPTDAALCAQVATVAECRPDAARTWALSSSRHPLRLQREALGSGEARGRLWVFAKAVRDKKDLRQRQAARDAYLQAMSDQGAPDTDEESEPEEHARASSAGSGAWPQVSEMVSGGDTNVVDQEAMLQLYRIERRTFASSLLGDFVRIIKGKQQRAERSRARDSYLDRCAAEDGEAHEKASARVVADFMRNAAARNTLRRRAKIMNAYNDAHVAREEETDLATVRTEASVDGASAACSEVFKLSRSASSAARRIQRFVRGVQARRHLRALQEAKSLYLEEELAVEELLYSAALTIQRSFRRYVARRQAVKAIAPREV